MPLLGQLTDKQAIYSPADSEAHGYEHPENYEVPVAGAEADQEAGQGEGQGAYGQHHRPGQPLVQQVRQDGQEHGGEDEHQDERLGQPTPADRGHYIINTHVNIVTICQF